MSLRIARAPVHLSTIHSRSFARGTQLSAPFRPLPRRHHCQYFKGHRSAHQKLRIQESGISWTAVVVVSIAVGASLGVTFGLLRPGNTSVNSIPSRAHPDEYLIFADMASPMPPGRPGTLTPEQEVKLRELWQLCLRVFGVAEGHDSVTPNGNKSPPQSLSRTSSNTETSRKKKGRLSMFKKKNKEDASDSISETSNISHSGTTTSVSDIANGMGNDKHGTAKSFREAIASTSPSELRTAFWAMVKHDHPDALLLRFLRARKWDVNAALVMAISALHWRASDAKVDSDVIYRGEEGMLNLKESADPEQRKEGEDFIQQIRMGKSFLHGVDREGRPICYVRVRLHKPGEQSEASLERFTVFTIETARMLLRPPVDTATVIFDMTDFGLSNMDYTPVKFMIKCFEANYPESLGTVLVHKAPWVFQGIYRVIKGWLDPVVAAKVHFTNNLDDLEQLIKKEDIIKELGGPNSWSYQYPEPVAGENSLMKDSLQKSRLEGERQDLARKYEDVIVQWIESADQPTSAPGQDPASLRTQRDEVAKELRTNYWKLDPYVRARSLYDRSGELKPEVDGQSGQMGPPARPGTSTTIAAPTQPTRAVADGRPSVDSDVQSFYTTVETHEDDLD